MSSSSQDRPPATSLDVACRILTLASSVDQSIQFINVLRSCASTTKPTQTVGHPNVDAPSTVATIPWTISNKYYSADVHFQARPVAEFAPHHIRSAPAVIFVWNRGEPYREDFLRLAQSTAEYEPEVSLAVRLPRRVTLDQLVDDEQLEVPEEEDNEIDEFVSSHGFEFIDSRGEPKPYHDDLGERSTLADQGIPGLPRVIDALSTVMWPSMRPNGPPKVKLRAPNRQPFSWSTRTDSSSFGESFGQAISGIRLHKEAEDLVRWLEDDPSFRQLAKNDPWRSVSEPATVCASPTSSESALPINGRSLPENGQSDLGFDDDFTVFVSAPPDQDYNGSGQSTPNASFEFGTPNSSGLHAFQPSSLYRALGSASDLGTSSEDPNVKNESSSTPGPGPEESDADEDYDEDLPTQQEIAITAARIFGPNGSAPKSRSSKIPISPVNDGPDDSHSTDPPSLATETSTSLFSMDSLLAPTSDQEVDVHDLYDMAQFDLSRVLHALRGMKAEIASMEDEGERRRAAAKVALGLVYGLGGGGDEDEVTC